ncbi:uncharacterized protein MYCFIDRAFT_190533 [Pseudocercospora fijiensis CIRAD86]|uniref:Uncharacterized protein n=1 Tax=Pseudocercospora fijiensis (strain CIRAD86) TaxID=383855 RepID=M2YPW9_PSEFD|nr:uncharacterized protein MYCFIDRAFT_190533 [Pseudocercospora fijiensis CIRAD86]EME79755.1 hypothetical protein MYCFIDRAFT_190533 [Pseudocercospora fijiensis CIRAD86]
MSSEPIAIVGSACRFSGDTDSPAKLWQLLKNPQDLRQEIPPERFNVEAFYHPDHAYHGHANVKHSYLLAQDIARFDAEFFGINAMEANAMDPQQRLILETVYEAIESAGMTMEELSGSDTCVYAGSMTADYDAMSLRDLDHLPTYAAVGTSRAILSNRISYFFNWKGASMTIDTACSSSLVALHNAVQTLRSRDSGMAVVCGSNLIFGPESFIIESTVNMLSPDGLSRMWDKDANGYARGEGLAALVLKPLSAALEANDHIECVIRETGLNQDGHTAGLTMPSPSSQRDLIHSTYAKAGLDLRCPHDRPQYFEAHGTGTPAGVDHPLHVGSIKTVLGHTEGAAGLAGLLKAMLAIQNSCIPPNLHFNELNPSIEPFYKHLAIPCSVVPWPPLPPGQARRASVNSFGFGGSNAHAIIESYESESATSSQDANDNHIVYGPFVFSASSEVALRNNIKAYITYLEEHEDCNARDLAYTLRQRRSLLQYRLAIPATSCEILRQKLVEMSSGSSDAAFTRITRTIPKIGNGSGKILGIFTGQGAQYAGMGAELIRDSELARKIIQKLDSMLQDLPQQDRPSWSLEGKLLAAADESRTLEVGVSQPLTTAVQIMLVDLLGAAGIHFDVVVGHSSGEIAAAYAAKFLSARDAICIAYYRGMACEYSKSPNGNVSGAMLAVGTSMDDALEICRDDTFQGRISVAAVNSSSSVTISGDSDAIEELVVVMEDEQKFHRRLRVDRAYHSAHMQASAEPYAQGMKRARISAAASGSDSGSRQCQWYSSVYPGMLVNDLFPLSGEYWLENLVKPVMFEAALSAALQSSFTAFDVALEVGPHPALRGPAVQVMQDVLSKPVPYIGTLERGSGATSSFSTALGSLWSHLGRGDIDLDLFERMMSSVDVPFKLLKGLPCYQWNDETRYWSESRRSKHLRSRSEPVHPLLGHMTAESGPHALRWKHSLKPSEMPWLGGHAVQGQIVFPAAGYISSAIEAARWLANGDEIAQLVTLEQFVIHEAIPFQNEEDDIEVLIELTQISRVKDGQAITAANYTYSAALGGTSLSIVATCTVNVQLGQPCSSLLPARRPEPPHMVEVRPQRMYDYLEKLEYNFSGSFRSLTELHRRLGFSRCVGKAAERTLGCEALLVHPADLDAAFQAVHLACSYPGDEQIRHLHLPTRIDTIRINPAASKSSQKVDEIKHSFGVDAVWHQSDPLTPTTGFTGSASLFIGDQEPEHTAIQIDNVVLKPVGDSLDERKIYYGIDYVPTKLDGMAAAEGLEVTREVEDLMQTLRRIVYFYAAKFDREVPSDLPARVEAGNIKYYLDFCQHLTNELRPVEWMQDTKEDIQAAIHKLGPDAEGSADVKLHLLVGETMSRVFRGEADMLEELRLSGLLDDFYRYGAGLRQATLWLAAILKQITDRNPHLRLLEIGAGTGSATKDILAAIGPSFDDYTFTDISASFGDHAMEQFALLKDRVSFKTFDVEIDPIEQGFVEGQYDVVIASQVLHATTSLGETVRNARRLIRPGGWLLIGECDPGGRLRDSGSFIFGMLTGWWKGIQDGRRLSPFISAAEWDVVLRENGFCGIETMNPEHLGVPFGITAMAAQATDERMTIIRAPLSSPKNLEVEEVLIIGGQTDLVAQKVEELRQTLTGLGARVSNCKTLEEIDDNVDHPGIAIISLADLDQPVFQEMTPDRWASFQKLFVDSKSMLWVTCGRLKSEIYSNMTVGFGRGALNEESDLRLQFLDFDSISQLDTHVIAETFVVFTNQTVLEATDKKHILHISEREIIIDDQGRELVPRLAHQTRLNNRLSSTRRVVEYPTDLRDQEVALEQNSSGCFLRQLSRFDKHELVELRMQYSTLSAIRTPWGYRSLVLGVDSEGRKFISLTTSVRSVLRVSAQSLVEVENQKLVGSQLIYSIAVQMIALSILEPVRSGQRIIVHNSPLDIAIAISGRARQHGIHVVFTTDDTSAVRIPQTNATPSVRLHPFAGRLEVDRVVDTNVSYLTDLSLDQNRLSVTLASLVPAYCRKETWDTLRTSSASDVDCHEFVEPLKLHLDTAWKQVSASRPGRVIDWTSATCPPARLCRLDVVPLFRPDRTYWLCGLSGPLGTSICDWMIACGVRNMVISSRNPKINELWIDSHRKHRRNINIKSCDVTDEAALRKVHQEIVEELPPISGVVSAAMVLRDVAIRNMEYDQLQDVIRPKVLGSIHLDRIFHDVDLDFFIVLSSTNAIIGNPGQANYAAANMGMAGVANARRARGLRASVAHVGAIIGVGYVTNSIERLDLTVTMTNMIRVSEEEVHQMIAEVLEAGFEDSSVPPELVMGLKEVSLQDPGQSKWVHDPKFCRLLLPTTTGDGRNQAAGAVEVSVRESLEACKTGPDVHQVLKQAFAAQMRKTLFIKLSDDEIMLSSSNALGLDSLIAVDIRSWILKTFNVSIPVLQIMSADTRISDLVTSTMQELPASMTPSLHPDQDRKPSQASAVGSDTPSESSEHSSRPSVSTAASDWSSSVRKEEPIVFDWDYEARAPEEIVAYLDATPPRKKPEVILLTGVTGLLGHHLLGTLLASDSVRQIICIAVRRLSDRLGTASTQLPTDGRIEYHEGDLALPNFGLAETEIHNIFAKVDAVIHNGADTSHMRSYATLHQVNVQSTRTILRNCVSRHIPLHYISSAGIALASDLNPFPAVAVNGSAQKLDEISKHGAQGYMCSKWVCERMLENVGTIHGLPVWIHRPSTIVREGQDAATERAGLDWVNALLQYCHKTQSVPRVHHNKGCLDLVYAKTCCDGIVSDVLSNSPRVQNGPTYRNLVNDIVIPMAELNQVAFQAGRSSPYSVVSWSEWVDKAVAAGLNPAVAALIETMDEPGGHSYPRLLR